MNNERQRIQADLKLEELKDKAREWDILAKENLELRKEIERLKEQLNDEIQEELKQSEIMVKKQQEIERLNNIIKEVRKYIEENDNKEPWKSLNGKDILEILDKGE